MKTTEELAIEAGFWSGVAQPSGIKLILPVGNNCTSQLETFRRLCVEDYFASAEPAACGRSG